MSVRAPVGPVNITTQEICIGRGLCAIRPLEGQDNLSKKLKKDRKKVSVDKDFLFINLKLIEDRIKGGGGSVFDSINRKQIEKIQIPLPPLEVQKEIVAEIESYQKIIDGAKQVIDNWKPTFKIDPQWPIKTLGKICDVRDWNSRLS